MSVARYTSAIPPAPRGVLASDEFAGRGPGEAGELKTVEYLSKAFAAAGLEPGDGHGGWTQPVPLVRLDRQPGARLSLTVAGRTQSLTPGSDAMLALRNAGRTGSGAEVPLLSAEDLQTIGAGSPIPYDVSPDGRHLLVEVWGDSETGADIWLIALDKSSQPKPLVRTPANEIIPSFSPRGNFLSYHSNKAGYYGIYVRPFPDVDRREWTIPARGGYDARWSPGRNEILYRFGARQLMSVPYELTPEFRPGTERLVVAMDAHDSPGNSFDLSADGNQILVNRPAMSWTDPHPVVLVSDWSVELEKLAGRVSSR